MGVEGGDGPVLPVCCKRRDGTCQWPASCYGSGYCLDGFQWPVGVVVAGEDANPKDIAGRAKPQLHLIPLGSLEGVARVMELGARKYGAYNWREKRITRTTYLSAAWRHMAAYLDREDTDPESGQLHLDHAIAGLMILRDAIYNGTSIDDRPVKPAHKDG